ncbi:hypothetical protein [Candidatus Parabeggiatoa sp. HSG14]|uniref:hypothetical protein n=1 Tax=Candidatus Parabeggiatoa sp. HSG14 TaxID=3055593 RepID=UPI0025A83348|nr:hypothetical protein [Thiotrichales bacterium HSG14]
MSNKDDQDWLDLLAGQSISNADPKIMRDAQIFRAALLANADKNDAEIPYPDLWENISKKIPPPIQVSPAVPFWKKIFQKIKELITSLISPPQMVWAIPAVSFVLVVSIIMYVIWPQNLIDTTYQTIYANKTDEMVDKLRDFKFRWEGDGDNVFAFAPTEQPSQATKAFGAGLLMGREALLGKNEIALPILLLPSSTFDTWLKTQWADNFELGRWTVLLWIASQSHRDLPPTFWDEQRKIFSQLKAAFVARSETRSEAKKVLFQLENKIKPHLEKLPTKDSPRVYKELAFNLKKMMYFLGPKPESKL